MIQFLRGTQSQLQSSQQVFAAGQPIFESDTGQLKIGNGVNNFAGLPYVGGSSGGGWTKIQAESPSNSGWISSMYTDLDDHTRLTIGQGYITDVSNKIIGNQIVTLDDSNDSYQWAVTFNTSASPCYEDPSILTNYLYYGATANLNSSTLSVWVSNCWYWTTTHNMQVTLSVVGNDRSNFNAIPDIPISYWIVSSNI